MNQAPLKIILSKKGPSSESARQEMPRTGENVTAACPNHLIISDLSVAKSIGRVPAAARVKEVKFNIRSKPGEKVHICVKCNIPIAIYGRLSPCEHAFCRDCALECRSNCECYVCGAQIQKIQTINMGKGEIFICGNLSCLKSFCEKNAFKDHLSQVHGEGGSNSINNGGNGDLHMKPINGRLPRPTGQLNP